MELLPDKFLNDKVILRKTLEQAEKDLHLSGIEIPVLHFQFGSFEELKNQLTEALTETEIKTDQWRRLHYHLDLRKTENRIEVLAELILKKSLQKVISRMSYSG